MIKKVISIYEYHVNILEDMMMVAFFSGILEYVHKYYLRKKWNNSADVIRLDLVVIETFVFVVN